MNFGDNDIIVIATMIHGRATYPVSIEFIFSPRNFVSMTMFDPYHDETSIVFRDISMPESNTRREVGMEIDPHREVHEWIDHVPSLCLNKHAEIFLTEKFQAPGSVSLSTCPVSILRSSI